MGAIKHKNQRGAMVFQGAGARHGTSFWDRQAPLFGPEIAHFGCRGPKTDLVTMNTKLALLLLALSVNARSNASTILSVSGPGEPAGCLVIWAGQGYRVGWTQSDTYDVVSVSATLSSWGAPDQTGRAYLTTQIGVGTTVTNEIVSTNFTFPLTPANVVLFQGLHLPPGAYYLSIIGDSPSWGSCWNGFIATNVVTAPDVTSLGCFGAAGGIINAYFPASPVYADNPIPPGIDVEGVDLNHPRLDITQSGGLVLISWSTNSVGFNLQSTPNLGTTNWEAVVQRPIIISDAYVFVTIPDGTRLYRLAKPAN